jgi:hypothetical protein
MFPTRLVWDPIEGATHYKLFRKVEGGLEYSDMGVPNTTSLTGIGGYPSNEVIVRVPFPVVQNLRVE